MSRTAYCTMFVLHLCIFAVLACILGPKNGSSYSTEKEKRSIVRTAIELNMEIITKFANGVRCYDVPTQCSMATSTISTFLKNSQSIKAADVVKGVMPVYSKQRPLDIG